MGQQVTLELSDAEYRVLEKLARQTGTTPSEWATKHLQPRLQVDPSWIDVSSVAPELVELLESAAVKSGRAYEEVATSFLLATAPQPRPKVSRAEARAAKKRFLQQTVDLGYATSADNESIDADLAREYADTHECSDVDDPVPSQR